MSWCYPDEHSDYAYAVLNELERAPALVPSLWALEIANAVTVGERRLRLSRADADRFLELLNGLPIRVDIRTAERALTHTLPLARAHNLSAYDASYLELSMREGLACDARPEAGEGGAGSWFANLPITLPLHPIALQLTLGWQHKEPVPATFSSRL